MSFRRPTDTGEERQISYPLLLATVALASTVAPLNSTMLAIALPVIRADFRIGHETVAWLISSYLIAMAVAQPVGGRIGDQIGLARAFRLGLLAFLAFSIGAAVSPNFVVLVLMRTGQAMMGAAIISNGTAMLRLAATSERLGTANGVIGSVLALAAALGPLLGAVALEAGSWPLLFLVNVPLTATALCGLWLLNYHEPHERTPLRIDPLGIVLFAALLTLLTHLIEFWRRGGLLAAAEALLLLIVLAVFVKIQLRAAKPIAEWSLFRIPSFAAATAFILLSNLVMYTTLLAVPFFILEVQAGQATRAGVIVALMSAAMALAGLVSGRLSDYVGRRPVVLLSGIGQFLAAVFLVLALDQEMPPWAVTGFVVFIGVSVGLGSSPAMTAALEIAPREIAGVVAGTISMMRYFGSILSAGAIGAFLGAGSVFTPIEVYRLLFLVLALAAALATGAAFMVHRKIRLPSGA